MNSGLANLDLNGKMIGGEGRLLTIASNSHTNVLRDSSSSCVPAVLEKMKKDPSFPASTQKRKREDTKRVKAVLRDLHQ